MTNTWYKTKFIFVVSKNSKIFEKTKQTKVKNKTEPANPGPSSLTKTENSILARVFTLSQEQNMRSLASVFFFKFNCDRIESITIKTSLNLEISHLRIFSQTLITDQFVFRSALLSSSVLNFETRII